MPRRSGEVVQATRERLLDAALQPFLARGVGRTALGGIATAAGAIRGAEYWHFTDRTARGQARFGRVDLPSSGRCRPPRVKMASTHWLACGAWRANPWP